MRTLRTLNRPLFVMCLLFVTVALAPRSALAAPVALITDVQGSATLTVSGRSADAGILADIEPGTQLQLPANSTLVVLYLADGSEYLLQGPAQVVFRADRPEVTSGAPAIRRAAVAGGGTRLRPGGLGQGAIVMRSLVNLRVRLLSASNTLLLETQPELRWMAPEPGLRYSISVSDDTGRSLYQGEVDGTSFALPASLQLRDGVAYGWQVSARSPDGRVYTGRGEFGLANAQLRAQAEAARGEVGSAVSSQVAMALWLEQQELRDEARKLWRALAVQRPQEQHIRAMAER
ncbi:MAG: hypothetical protein ABIN37_09475 [Burkholderiaceae bacterium]